MRLVAAAAIAMFAAMAAQAGEPDKPVTKKDVTAGDVAATPVTDLNLRKGQIPPLLLAAEERPYTLRGLGACQQIAAAIGELDAVLGEDIDVPQTGGKRTTPGRMAQEVVGSFIPFRGLIREVSGASSRDKDLQVAIWAGIARRSFLKGVGETRGCRYPARSVTPEVYARRMAELEAQQQQTDAKQPRRR